MPQRELRQPYGIFPTSSDSKRRRAHDELLQVCQMHTRMARELDRYLLSQLPRSTLMNLTQEGLFVSMRYPGRRVRGVWRDIIKSTQDCISGM